MWFVVNKFLKKLTVWSIMDFGSSIYFLEPSLKKVILLILFLLVAVIWKYLVLASPPFMSVTSNNLPQVLGSHYIDVVIFFLALEGKC